MVFKKVEPNVWKPELVGEEIVGVLIEKKPSDKYASYVYILSVDNKPTTIYGTTILDDRMQFCKVGDKVKIVYDGMTKNKKGQDTHLYSVFIDDGTIEVVKI